MEFPPKKTPGTCSRSHGLTEEADPRPEDGGDPRPLTRKEAARDLLVCLKTRGMRFELDVSRLMITAKLNHATQAVVLRGEGAGMRWCMVWETFRGENGPTVEPVLPIGQEWELSRRLLDVLELGQLEL
ncbi:hypothetical protein GCM10007147_22850 [Nocardiopsis kunsanensis]|uniref:Uncharacterized protein n=1 Tax=Nocardiopsis kunsanensis TaxID=141693 RepID=A0A919CHU9_9ACTN|nr:hypothetical protein [Nocardiopsis kunsanensis]GHD25472.1 hypothetical protein GCM10007147_22850 [Nocardiopsis kunsanensis]